MTVLGKDAILAAADIQPELVDVPEWGGQVYVRGLTASERDQFEFAVVRARDGQAKRVNIRAQLVAWGLCDEAGHRLFSDAEVAQLGRKSALAMERVFDRVRHLSAMTDEDVAELESDLPGPSGGSSTSLPSPSEE